MDKKLQNTHSKVTHWNATWEIATKRTATNIRAMPRTPARGVWAKILQAVPAVPLRDLANRNVKVSANQRSLSDCHSMGKAIEHFVRRGGNPDSVVDMHKVEAFSDLMDNIPDRFQSKEKPTRKHRSSPNKHRRRARARQQAPGCFAKQRCTETE